MEDTELIEARKEIKNLKLEIKRLNSLLKKDTPSLEDPLKHLKSPHRKS